MPSKSSLPIESLKSQEFSCVILLFFAAQVAQNTKTTQEILVPDVSCSVIFLQPIRMRHWHPLDPIGEFEFTGQKKKEFTTKQLWQ